MLESMVFPVARMALPFLAVFVYLFSVFFLLLGSHTPILTHNALDKHHTRCSTPLAPYFANANPMVFAVFLENVNLSGFARTVYSAKCNYHYFEIM